MIIFAKNYDYPKAYNAGCKGKEFYQQIIYNGTRPDKYYNKNMGTR